MIVRVSIVLSLSTTLNSSFQNYTNPDDHTQQTTDTPGFKPFTERILLSILLLLLEKGRRRIYETRMQILKMQETFTRQTQVWQFKQVAEKIGKNRNEVFLSIKVWQHVCQLLMWHSYRLTWVCQPKFAWRHLNRALSVLYFKVFCMAPKPYDKHPEWETLRGHSAAVRSCCIGNRESGHPLIATASDDCTVQLWDTRNMPSPKVVKLPVRLMVLNKTAT